MDQKDGITEQQAFNDLGEKSYYSFLAWMREKGYINLEQTGESNWKRSKIFITKSQLLEFKKEVLRDFKGTDDTGVLWGQSREYWSGQQGRKKR